MTFYAYVAELSSDRINANNYYGTRYILFPHRVPKNDPTCFC